MSQITLKGNPINTNGDLISQTTKAPGFTLVKSDLSEASLSDYTGKQVILNIFPSIDTGTCATSVREFNKKASELENTVVLCISKDLPFAHSRFCAAEGIDNVITLSAFRNDSFANDYGIELVDGPLRGLIARAVVVVDTDGQVTYSQLVGEVTDEPDYDSAIAALS